MSILNVSRFQNGRQTKPRSSYLSNIHTDEQQFGLDSSFISSYTNKKPNFGYNGLGEFVFFRTYSRLKPDNTKESFLDVIKRVVEGTYEIQRRHCRELHIPWDYKKALESAQEMFERMWTFKFLPPGRGLWCMGTPFMWERGSAALNNCGFVSTQDLASDPAEPFSFLMDMSMLGVGVGFDTRGKDQVVINRPNKLVRNTYIIPDSREGWVESVRYLILSYTTHTEIGYLDYDYSNIRPAGTPIRGFGGFASGPQVLAQLHEMLREFLDALVGKVMTSRCITDIMNMVGAAIVAGNVRRVAEIAFGDADDFNYTTMKNPVVGLDGKQADAFWAIATALYKMNEKKDGSSSTFKTTPEQYLSLQKNLLERSRDIATLKNDQVWFDNNKASFEAAMKVEFDTDKLPSAIRTLNYLNQHRWASNNSVFATVGMNYAGPASSTSVNGEPGYIWLENIRDYGRMIDGIKPGIDGRAMGTNPCFAGDMRLFTANSGYRTLRQLWVEQGCKEYAANATDPFNAYGKQEIINKNGRVAATSVYRTSEKADLFRVTFSNGSWIDATHNHKFIVLTGDRALAESRKALADLNIGDRIPVMAQSFFPNSDQQTDSYTAYAELAGWCVGDGSLSPKADGQTKAICNCYGTDINTVMPKLQQMLQTVYGTYNRSTDQSPAYEPWERPHGDGHDSFSHEEKSIGSNVLGRLMFVDGVVSGSKHHVPVSLWNSNKNAIAAFIRGLASADGGVQVNEANKTISIRIAQSNREFLLDMRLLLTYFGITSTVNKRRPEHKKVMNDGNGGTKEYDCKAQYDLIVSGRRHVKAFLNQIGFIQSWKAEIGQLWLNNHHGSNNTESAGTYTKVVSVEYIGQGETFCLTEPNSNALIVEGHHVGNCGEQSLESYELCCLGETFPAKHDSDSDYLRTLKFAYLYTKTVTLLPTHNARTNQVMLRNRRIGLSQSGIVQAFNKFGRRNILRNFCDAGYTEVRRWDRIYSEWLCIPQSIKVTCVKPSGTVSLVVGATPGIHYPEARYYWRHVRVSKTSALIKILQDAGYYMEPALNDPEQTVVVRFAVDESEVRPVAEVSMWEQTQNVADYQKYWADNQPSCTVKFKRSEAPQLEQMLQCYEDRLKCIALLPADDHNYAQTPYTPCTKEEVEAYIANTRPMDFSSWIGEDADVEGVKGCDGPSCSIISSN